MSTLRRKVEDLGESFYCPIHRDRPLVCSECDLAELPEAQWAELERLLEAAGYFRRPPLPSVGPCWQCGEGELCCLECGAERGEPPDMALLSEADRDRLFELAEKLIPPWLA
jgi:hypothetical protein